MSGRAKMSSRLAVAIVRWSELYNAMQHCNTVMKSHSQLPVSAVMM